MFRIFPALSGSDDQARSGPRKASIKKRKTLGTGRSSSVNVAFGAKTKPSRHRLYQEYSLKASAWIATALHRLNAGKAHVKKWFILSSDRDLPAQMQESRRHLTRMLQLMSWFLIEKGTPEEVGGPCSFTQTEYSVGGTMAYVAALQNCGVNSRYDCGEKTQA